MHDGVVTTEEHGAAQLVDRALGRDGWERAGPDLRRSADAQVAAGVDSVGLGMMLRAGRGLARVVPWAFPAADIPPLEEAERCLAWVVPEPERAEVLGDEWQRGRLLEGLARRCGIDLGRELLETAGPWWFTVAFALLHQPDVTGSLSWLPAGHRRMLQEFQVGVGEGAVGLTWWAPPAEVAEACWRVLEGHWMEAAWETPRLGIWRHGVAVRGPAAYGGTVTRRVAKGSIRAWVPVRPDDLGRLSRTGWTVREVRGLSSRGRGLG